jgi:hypothetical protein
MPGGSERQTAKPCFYTEPCVRTRPRVPMAPRAKLVPFGGSPPRKTKSVKAIHPPFRETGETGSSPQQTVLDAFNLRGARVCPYRRPERQSGSSENSVEALHSFRCCTWLRPARAKQSSAEAGALSGRGGFTLTTYRGACQHLAMRAEALSCGRPLGRRGGRRFRFKVSLRRPSLTRDVKPRLQSTQICLKTAVSQPNPMDKRRRSRAKPELGWLRVLIAIHKMADASESCQKCQFTLT